jgi:hypothetical protein
LGALSGIWVHFFTSFPHIDGHCHIMCGWMG